MLDAEKCVGCNRCARNCKASCIDVEHHRIDYSRCVVCMDCIDTCHKNAIAYELRPKTRKPGKEEKRESGREENPAGLSRRSFLSLTGVFAAHTALRAQEKLTDGGLAVIEQKKIPRRATPIVPAGAASLRNMAHHCTGCQLCVAVCPNGVLWPSEKLTSLMQPEMSYERGYCRPECTKCSEVCPAGAILPVTAAEKSSVQIGHAVWIRANCVPLTDGVDCGNCARHCPSEAITMVPSDTADPDSPKIPVVNTERCIGCGACAEACHEGAIAMVEGKAQLMRDDYCDGLGDCLPACPTGAISFVEREAAAYDEQAVLANKQKKMQEKMRKEGTPLPCGCPGSQSRSIRHTETRQAETVCAEPVSRLSQWPVQIKLVPVRAPYFDGAKLLIAADCTAYAYAAFHERFIKGHITLVGCPKLDSVDYSEKLTEIIRENDVKSVTVVRMEVPCCGGLERAAVTALKNSGKFIPWQVVTVTLDGRLKEE